MIFQSLCEYYQRKSADPNSTDMSSAGWQWKELPFVIVLSRAGQLTAIEDYREEKNGRKRARSFLVPQEVQRTVGVASNTLWDKPAYIWGFDADPKAKPDRLAKQRKAFIEALSALPQDDDGIKAALAWLSDPDTALQQAQANEHWPVIAETAPFMALRLDGDVDADGQPLLVCNRPAVQRVINEAACAHEEHAEMGVCLVTGEQDYIARLHTPIKGVPGAQTSGASIVSFNQPSFCSYGKAQGGNAPVGEKAMSSYTKALNFLLRKDSRQKIQCGGTTVVFWARKKDGEETETLISELLGDYGAQDDPDRAEGVRGLLQSIHKGGGAGVSEDRFYVLGISPNASRLSVRFWLPTTVTSIRKNISNWFEQVDICGGKAPYPPLRSLLSAAAFEYKLSNLSPLLEGEMVESIFRGTRFPETLLTTALQRMRAEQNLPHLRAALIKAYLIRNKGKDIRMSLDTHNADIGYQLGRLFAALEKTQEEAMPGVKATIRERYFTAASTRPAMVFPALARLHIHHMGKMESRGRAVNLEKQVGEIMKAIPDKTFPAILSLEQQGSFAIGYYHQRQAFFTKKEHEEAA